MEIDKKNNTKKHATVKPMILTPIVFVLILMVVAVPLFAKGFGVAKEKLHSAQSALSMSLSDIKADDAYFEECKKEGVAMTREGLMPADKVATLSCNNAAIGCDVYYGINRVSKRNGVGLSIKEGLFGEGKQIHIDGDAFTFFKALENVEKGDVFTVEASDGEYRYVVKEVLYAEEYSGKTGGEYLLLTTDEAHEAFSHQNKNKLMVVATLAKGEVD